MKTDLAAQFKILFFLALFLYIRVFVKILHRKPVTAQVSFSLFQNIIKGTFCEQHVAQDLLCVTPVISGSAT
jgi:hypothetical protein